MEHQDGRKKRRRRRVQRGDDPAAGLGQRLPAAQAAGAHDVAALGMDELYHVMDTLPGQMLPGFGGAAGAARTDAAGGGSDGGESDGSVHAVFGHPPVCNSGGAPAPGAMPIVL